MDEIECIVIGAGVVGLACARALALAGHDVVIVEANYAIGMETSSRNSEVIHSGIYYPTGSLKASACVSGRDKLYEYCAQRGIAHQRLGKLIVATSDEDLSTIEGLLIKGQQNGVSDLKLISKKETLNKESELSCVGALWSPLTGIIDSHSFMLAMQGDLEDQGGMIAFNTPLVRGEANPGHVVLETGGEAPTRLQAKLVINCGGLKAQEIASAIDGFSIKHIPQRSLARGVYFDLAGRSPFSHLIYPAPEPGGLGVHATLDIGGQCRFGPDVEWIDKVDYQLDANRSQHFYNRIRQYWPGLKDGALKPAYAGIRPKIVGRGEPAGDFIIQGPDEHGSGPIINLFGIESPGLTSSLALAEEVLELARPILQN